MDEICVVWDEQSQNPGKHVVDRLGIVRRQCSDEVKDEDEVDLSRHVYRVRYTQYLRHKVSEIAQFLQRKPKRSGHR